MRYALYDPLQLEPFESGIIGKDDFIAKYHAFPFEGLLKKQNEAMNKGEEIKWAPGLETINQEGNAIYVSIVGELDDYEFYICYKRPIMRKRWRWFREIEYLDKDFFSIIPQQTREDGLRAFCLFFDKNYEELGKHW